MRALIFAALMLTHTVAIGQSEDRAKTIYDSSEASVFLVYTNDSSGTPNAQGSAFVVGKRLLMTNAHVVADGAPVLAVGPVRIPLTIVRVDQVNDLALLSVDVDLTSKPLPLSKAHISPGETVFAIGNPEGLEKSISQGIVAGIRKRGARDLIQITSPISHGSSGGPILDENGEVVGVAVGILEDGQNLNFAVPASKVDDLIESKAPNAFGSMTVSDGLDQVAKLLKERSTKDYSDDPTSEYQRESTEIIQSLEPTIAKATKESDLAELACFGPSAFDLSDAGMEAAKKLVALFPSADNRSLLAYTLFDRADDESIVEAFAKDGSEESAKAKQAHEEFLLEADNEAAQASRQAKGDRLLLSDFVLGSIRHEQDRYSESISLLSEVVRKKLIVCGNDLTEQSYRELITACSARKQPDDAERWFRRYASSYIPTAYEWDSEGDRRSAAQDHLIAADAYEKAASMEDRLSYDYCFASQENYYLSNAPDAVLTDGRKCAEASIKQAGKDDKHYFESQLPIVYQHMASVLAGRGVFQEALGYIKESLAARPEEPFALDIEADILADLERYPECIAAATAAIRAADGKYAWMHFRLGYCYFATENWSQAATSFRLAADADKTDAVSAFNLGLSLQRQGYNADAEQWYREALSRKPDDELRAKILRALH